MRITCKPTIKHIHNEQRESDTPRQKAPRRQNRTTKAVTQPYKTTLISAFTLTLKTDRKNNDCIFSLTRICIDVYFSLYNSLEKMIQDEDEHSTLERNLQREMKNISLENRSCAQIAFVKNEFLSQIQRQTS